jgi:hypothetical protein
VPTEKLDPQRNASWSRTLVRATLICGGTVAILLPAWLPNRPTLQIERGTVELLQALLMLAAATVMLGASPHAGANRPVCRILAMGFLAAFIAEIKDFIFGCMHMRFPEAWVISCILLIAAISSYRHRRVMVHFLGTLGNHAGTGLIVAALLIIYIFNHVIGSSKFWRACLGPDFPPQIPRICTSYLELLACYLIFIGALGLSITMARRKNPK